jgi:hypothetical protein
MQRLRTFGECCLLFTRSRVRELLPSLCCAVLSAFRRWLTPLEAHFGSPCACAELLQVRNVPSRWPDSQCLSFAHLVSWTSYPACTYCLASTTCSGHGSCSGEYANERCRFCTPAARRVLTVLCPSFPLPCKLAVTAGAASALRGLRARPARMTSTQYAHADKKCLLGD